MRSFFIDLENVRSYGLEGILLLKPEDKVYVFYSDNANTLTIPTIESLNESSAQVKYIKTNYIGANAMDFQIVTLLGASIEKEQTGRFYIISHDNGFKSAVKFCEGYFTGYDIVTGVFANILLAINSEKNTGLSAKKENRTNKQNSSATTNGTERGSNADDESQKDTQSKRRSRNRRRKSGASASADNANLTESRDNLNNDQADPIEAFENVPSQSVDMTDTETEKSNSRSRSRNRRRRGRNNANAGDNDSLNKSSSDIAAAEDDDNAGAEDGFMIIQASETQKDSHQNSRRSRNRNNRKNDGSKDNSVNNQDKKSGDSSKNDQDKKSVGNSKNNPNDVQKSSNYKYVYNALSEFLSKSTIDMYAAKIDEGIRHSANKNELHQFFKKNYGTDEAEALYKIIYSDFDKMKKEAGN